MQKIVIYSALSLFFTTSLVGDEIFNKAMNKYRNYNFAEAMELFDNSCSENQNKQGCYNLAVMYKYGQGTKINRHKSGKYFLKACGKVDDCDYIALSKR